MQKKAFFHVLSRKIFNSQDAADSEVKHRHKGAREGVPFRGLVLLDEASPSAKARDFASVAGALLTPSGSFQSSTLAPEFSLVLSVHHYSGSQQTQYSRAGQEHFLRN